MFKSIIDEYHSYLHSFAKDSASKHANAVDQTVSLNACFTLRAGFRETVANFSTHAPT
jgi:hypothetical protein